MKLEMFIDPAYYDMWCVKPIGMKDFNFTLHFNTEKEAGYAKQVIEKWMTEASKREWVGISEEEVAFIWHDMGARPKINGYDFAKVLESKLKEKNYE